MKKRSATPPTVVVRRSGWRDKEKHTMGLKDKEIVEVSRDLDGVRLVDDLVSRGDQSNTTVYVRRKFFPIMLAASSSSSSSMMTSQSFSDVSVPPHSAAAITTTTTRGSNNNLISTTSILAGMGERANSVTHDELKDALSVIVLDEKTPSIVRRETQLSSIDDEYDLPPGARVVGDRVFLMQKRSLFSSGDDGDEQEINVPIEFFRKRKQAPAFGFGGGPSPFGEPSFGESSSFGGNGHFGTKKGATPKMAASSKGELKGAFNPFSGAATTAAAGKQEKEKPEKVPKQATSAFSFGGGSGFSLPTQPPFGGGGFGSTSCGAPSPGLSLGGGGGFGAAPAPQQQSFTFGTAAQAPSFTFGAAAQAPSFTFGAAAQAPSFTFGGTARPAQR